jgi:hypothetical protein
MAYDTFFVKDVSNGLANSHHIHVWQRLLGEETSCIHVLSRSKSVHGSHHFNLAMRLNDKGDAWACHLMTQASWRCLDYAAHTTVESHVFLPTFEQGRHCNLGLSWKVLGNDWLNLLNQVNILIQLSLFEQLERLDKIDVQIGVSSTVEFVVYLEDPGGHIQVLRDQLGKGVDELLFVVDVHAANRCRHICQLKYLFSP